MSSQDRPNFLFIMTDQHRADWLGCAGHPVVQTPNLDSLAATGTRFSNFQVTSPICMPNRASFMTGRYPSVHGLRHNGCWFSADNVCFTDVLHASGYDTAMIGKSHFHSFTGAPAMGLEDGKDRLIRDARFPESDRHSLEAPSNYESDERFEFPESYFGFRHVDMVTGHGDRAGGHYFQWFRQTYENWQELRSPENELPHNYSVPQAYRTPIPEEAYPTRYVGDRAVEWLTERQGNDAPFFTYVSFPDPHHPFNPPGKYWDMYHPDQFEVSLSYESHKNPTPPMQWMNEQYEQGGGQLTLQTAMRCGDQQLREAMALTAGMITMIDDEVGRIIQALKDNGLYDNTVICFNSDHGDYLGDFNMLLKGAMPFQSVTRVPMIWSDPASRLPRESDALATTIDLSATILDRVGLTPYYGMQGESFLPVLKGESDTHRDIVLTEFNDGLARLGFEKPARVRSLLSDRWRFTIYQGLDWGELYDLEADPDECCNLWESHEHAGIRAELSLRLNHLLTAQMDESPVAVHLA